VKRAVIRLPVEVVERLDQLARELRVANPQRPCTRASLVRALIVGGLAVAERAGGAEADVEADAAGAGAPAP
jgi:predicted transcriptional regulator